MMAHADEPITREDGGEQKSFIVEGKSLSGSSGSPVFITTTQLYRALPTFDIRFFPIKYMGNRDPYQNSKKKWSPELDTILHLELY